MMKWLRDHTKQIMVLVVMLAMFSFVGAQGLQAILAPNPANEKVMRAFGADISTADLIEATNDTEVLGSLYVNWMPPGAGADFDRRHWLMLAEEADRSGVQVSDVEIARIIDDRNTLLAPAGGIDSLRQSRNIGLPQIRHALGRYLSIMQNAQRVIEASLPSEPQVRKYVRDTNEKVSVKMAVFDAKNFVDADAPVAEAELQAQFEANKDVIASESENGVGYRYPRRVSIQYVVIEPGRLESKMNISLDDVKEHWKANKDRYTKSVQVPLPVDPAATQPATPQMVTEQRPKLFSEAREQVELELKRAKAKRVARKAINKIVDAMSKPWAQLQRDEKTGYVPIPNDEVRDPAYMNRIVAEVGAELGVELNYNALTLASESDIADDPNLKGAKLSGDDDNEPTIGLSEVAFRVPTFFEPKSAESSEVRMQFFQPPPATLRVEQQSYSFANGQLVPTFILQKYVLFRVIDARDSEVPASLDEVREAVTRDVREQRAYEAMDTICREYGAAAQQLGTETALTFFDELRTEHGILSVKQSTPFARKQRRVALPTDSDDAPMVETAFVADVGRSDTFVDACFAMADENWKASIIDAPMSSERLAQVRTQPPVEPAPKVRIIDLPEMRKRVVVEFVKHDPVDRIKYETTLRAQAYDQLTGARGVISKWFDPVNIEARCNYVDLRPKADDPQTGLGPDDADDDNA